MAKGEKFYDSLGIEEGPKQKIDIKRIKGNKDDKDISDEAALELAEQKLRQEKQAEIIAKNKKKIEKKAESGYAGGRNLRGEEKTAIADNSDKNKTNKELQWWKERRGVIKLKLDDIMEESEIEQEEIVQAEPEGDNLEKLKKEETELMEKLQQLPKSDPREPLSEEKKEIIAKLEQNRETQDIIAEAKQAQTESKETIKESGIKADTPEIIKNAKREESPAKQDKQPKVFQQQHLTDEYLNELKEEQRIEKENKEINDLRERIKEREKNMPDKIDDALIEKDLEKSANEIKERAKKEMPEIAEITKDGKKGVEKENIELKTENAQLKEAMKEVNEQLFVMEDKIRDKIIEISVEEDKEKAHKTITAIKKFLSKPKVKLAITVGLMGAAYTAGGGAPAILALKPLLAKIGIGFIPYTYGISSWGGGAIAGASGRWLAEKIGLVKNKKDAKEAVKDFAIDLKKAANNKNIKPEENNSAQASEAEKQLENPGEIDIAGVVKLVQEAKKRGMTAQQLLEAFNNDTELIDGTIKAVETKMSIFAFSKQKRDINAAHKWLREKRDEIIKQNKERSSQGSNKQKPLVVESANEFKEPVESVKTGEPEEKNEAASAETKEIQDDLIKKFDEIYNKAAGDKVIFKFFKTLNNFEKDFGLKFVTQTYDLIIGKYNKEADLAIITKIKEAAEKYKAGQAVKAEKGGETEKTEKTIEPVEEVKTGKLEDEKKESLYEIIAKDKTPMYIQVKIPNGSEYSDFKQDSSGVEGYHEWRINNWSKERPKSKKEAKKNELLISKEGENLIIEFLKNYSLDKRYTEIREARGWIAYQLPKEKMEKVWDNLKKNPSAAYDLIDPELLKLVGLPSDLKVVLKNENKKEERVK